jgi:hypothetical protein
MGRTYGKGGEEVLGLVSEREEKERRVGESVKDVCVSV